MLLLGSFSKKSRPGKGFIGLLLLLLLYQSPACDGGKLYRVGVFCSAEESPQAEESAWEFFHGADEYVEIF